MSNTLSTQSPTIDDGSGAGGSRRRLIMVVGGAALLLVLGLGAYFLFLSGGEEEDLGPVPSGAAAAEESDGKKNKNSKGNDSKGNDNVPAEVDTNFAVGRDPFAPLPAEEVIPAPEPKPEPTTDTSGDGTGTTPEPTPTPTPTPTVDAATTYDVTLRSVNLGKDTAVIEVDGKRYSVKAKDMFPSSDIGPFKLIGVGQLSSGQDTALVVFGSDVTVGLVAGKSVTFTTL
jgi:hypothetical protein